jgi:HupF/HypC family
MMAVAPEPPAGAEAVPAESVAGAALTLARRFAAGATMWCVAPQWPAHGRHVAVEFVHPVIVGKRALPAVGIDGQAAVVTASLRLLVKPGDVLLAVGPADDDTAVLMHRAEAWGLATLWLGAGPRPEPSAARHILWSDNPDAGRAARSGDVVLLYHLLWELTHVVFEHPGLLAESPACADDVCVTCADDGRVGEVRRVHDGSQAEVLIDGQEHQVDVTLVDPVSPGDLVLVHAGLALTVVDGDRP